MKAASPFKYFNGSLKFAYGLALAISFMVIYYFLTLNNVIYVEFCNLNFCLIKCSLSRIL